MIEIVNNWSWVGVEKYIKYNQLEKLEAAKAA